jgi:hypothetical protein
LLAAQVQRLILEVLADRPGLLQALISARTVQTVAMDRLSFLPLAAWARHLFLVAQVLVALPRRLRRKAQRVMALAVAAEVLIQRQHPVVVAVLARF